MTKPNRPARPRKPPARRRSPRSKRASTEANQKGESAPDNEISEAPEEEGSEDERVVHRGDLKYVLLRLLSEGARHGYQMLKEIEDKTQGGYKPSPGSLYPSLSALEEAGYIDAELDDERRVYRITDEGMEALVDKKERVDAVMERAGRAGERHRSSRALVDELEQDFAELRRAVMRRARQIDFNLDAFRQTRAALEKARSEILAALDELRYSEEPKTPTDD